MKVWRENVVIARARVGAHLAPLNRGYRSLSLHTSVSRQILSGLESGGVRQVSLVAATRALSGARLVP